MRTVREKDSSVPAVARGAGAVVIAAGGLVILGWAGGSDILKSLAPGRVGMNPGREPWGVIVKK